MIHFKDQLKDRISLIYLKTNGNGFLFFLVLILKN